MNAEKALEMKDHLSLKSQREDKTEPRCLKLDKKII